MGQVSAETRVKAQEKEKPVHRLDAERHAFFVLTVF